MSERFKISRLIGKNGTGGVYEAIDTERDQKVLLHRFFSEKGDTSTRGWDYLFKDIGRQWKIIDYPGFNLRMAKAVREAPWFHEAPRVWYR